MICIQYFCPLQVQVSTVIWTNIFFLIFQHYCIFIHFLVLFFLLLSHAYKWTFSSADLNVLLYTVYLFSINSCVYASPWHIQYMLCIMTYYYLIKVYSIIYASSPSPAPLLASSTLGNHNRLVCLCFDIEVNTHAHTHARAFSLPLIVRQSSWCCYHSVLYSRSCVFVRFA